MIVVIGSINLDLIATVDRLPVPGETVPGSAFATAPGGKGANQALAARRAGADVRMVGAVGRDSFASDALVLLDRAGVDLSGVARCDGPTGTALIMVDADGENIIAVVPGANASVTPQEVFGAGMRAGDHVLLQQEVPAEAVRAALAAARRAGAVSILNIAPFRGATVELADQADLVVANETEFDRYCGLQGVGGDGREARMRGFAEATSRTIVVTLGGEGAAAASGNIFLRVPALPVKPLDTVGAGDTFCGYLAAGLDAGMELDAALRLASAAGSLACTKAGAQPAIPSRGEVERAMSGGSGGTMRLSGEGQ